MRFTRWRSFSVRLFPGLAFATTLAAQVTFYSGASAFTNWQSAAGAGTRVTLDFEFVSAGVQAGNPTFVSQAASAGVAFQPFSNAQFPQVEIDNGGIGTIGAQWLGNYPVSLSYEAMVWNFTSSYRAFGFYDVGSDDGFTVTLYAADQATPLGSFDTLEQLGTPLFWGWVSSVDIGRVSVLPRVGNGFIGIDALSTVAIPEASMTSCLLGLGAALASLRLRVHFKAGQSTAPGVGT